MSPRDTYRILLVEDDDGAAELTTLQLEVTAPGRFLIDRAANRHDAVQLALDRPYDAALVDLQLPDAFATETLQDLILHAPHIAVVALTSSPDEAAFALLRLGASDFVSKSEATGERLTRTLTFAVERKAFETELRALADTDPLTGIGNRRRLEQRWPSLVARRDRTGGSIILLVLDIDEFGACNETIGHTAGDAALVAVASALTESSRDDDVVVRLGGDEFAVAILDATAQSAHAITERVHATASAVLREQDWPMTVSLGAAAERSRCELEDLLHAADRTLVTAKARGGCRSGVDYIGQNPPEIVTA